MRISALTLGSYAVGCGLILLACSPSDEAEEASLDTTDQYAHSGREMRAKDDCDPVTFGSLCDPNFDGETTLEEFSAELDATQQVGDWEYSSNAQVTAGQTFNVLSLAGETHTFTIVANYGGGFVQTLNDASGNPIPAPECLQPPSGTNVFLAAGSTTVFNTGTGTPILRGTHKVQCCIHPWMRSRVEVR